MKTRTGYFHFLFRPDKERPEVEQVRRKILDRLLFVFALFGLPAILTGIVQSYLQGRWIFSLAYGCLYSLFLIGTFAPKRLTYRTRAWVLVSTMFLVAFAILLRLGMSGVGLQLLLGVCFTAALLFGLRAGLVVILVSVAGVLFVALGMVSGFIEIFPEHMLTSQSLLAWMTGLCVFFIMVIITVSAPEMLRWRIEESRDLLEEQKSDAEAANRLLRREIDARRKTEAALRHSEEAFRTIFEESPFLMTLNELETGTYANVNRYFCTYAGLTKDQLIGKSFKDFGHFTDKAAQTLLMDKLIQKGRLDQEEIRLQNAANDRLTLQLSARIVSIQGKSYILSVLQDVTARKQTEEALRQSEANYRQLFDNAPAGIYRIDFRTGKFIRANDVMCQYLGYSQDELASLSPYDFLTEESKQAFLERLHKMNLGENVPENPEYEIIDKRGMRRWVQLNTQNFYDADGLAGADVVAHEITDRKRIERELRASEERYRLLAENATDVIWTLSLETMKFTYMSPSVLFMQGYTPQEAMEITVEDSLSRESFDLAMSTLHEELTREKSQNAQPMRARTLELQQRNKDGTLKWVEATVSFVRNASGAPIHVLGVTRDISERKRVEAEKRTLEERLQRAEKMEALGQMAGGVAHDLNNVLGILSGYSELLLAEIPEGQKSRNHAEKILQATEKGAAIIQDLLTLARRGVTISQVVNLNVLVSEFLKGPVFEKIKDHHPHVVIKAAQDAGLPNIKGSPIHLEKTLMNLVLNATESIFREGDVTIRTESRYLERPLKGYDEVCQGEYAVLSVTDTGSGIPVESVGKIFEPFFTKKTMGRSGTGLGLAIVWGTVKDHHGYIDVQTEMGKGSTFTLYFPATQEAADGQMPRAETGHFLGKGESVLVVDDIPEQRDIAVSLLTRMGYSAMSASSGEEALELLKTNKADVLILDMIMEPGIDGLETLQRILEINPQQKAILVSGYAETERVRKAQQLGAGAYVRKPYVMERIGLAIRKELDRRG